jgi:hypothetical protein
VEFEAARACPRKIPRSFDAEAGSARSGMRVIVQYAVLIFCWIAQLSARVPLAGSGVMIRVDLIIFLSVLRYGRYGMSKVCGILVSFFLSLLPLPALALAGSEGAVDNRPAQQIINGEKLNLVIQDSLLADLGGASAAEFLALTEQRVSASDAAPGGNFGAVVSFTDDFAFVGSPGAKIGANAMQGAVYVFKKVAGIWTQTQKLIASDGASYAQFGRALAAEGSVLVVGAPSSSGGISPLGAVYTFTLHSGVWSQAWKVQASDGLSGDGFGYAVGLSGRSLIVGAFVAGIGSNSGQGAAYVFTKPGGVAFCPSTGCGWIETQKLVASDGGPSQGFGFAVALEGTTAIIGARTAIVANHWGVGAAYVFARPSAYSCTLANCTSAWDETQRLTAQVLSTGMEFGSAIALEGTTALIASRWALVGSNQYQGAAYAFSLVNGSWVQTQQINPSDGIRSQQFASSLALKGDVAIFGSVGAVLLNDNLRRGAAYLFSRSGNLWTQDQKLVPSDGSMNDYFGESVSVSSSTIVSGALQGPNNTGEGRAYFYE